MGLKLEFILIFLTVGILAVALKVEIKDSKIKHNKLSKELEFTNTTFTEVDTNKTLGIAFGTYGVRNAGVLTVDNLIYHTDSIEDLRAKKGKYIGDKIYLDYNITVHQKEGSDYKAEHAVYDKKSEILNVTSPFTAVINGNVMYGDSLVYDTRKREAFGTNVKAVVYTKEK
jgi:hypothetical protein